MADATRMVLARLTADIDVLSPIALSLFLSPPIAVAVVIDIGEQSDVVAGREKSRGNYQSACNGNRNIKF